MLVTANVFQPLIDVFESVLEFFHNTGGISWGWSIVLLTVAVRAVLVPLTFRQIKSMVRMQGLAPQMKEIQKKYKDDKQRQQEEIMKFYRENNVNPLGSCLPMVLQLPVFISLYYMLRESLRKDICPNVQAMKQTAYAHAHHISAAAASGQTFACGKNAPGAHFLFISDLTAKATGIELGILIVLYVGSQLGSSLLMSAASMDKTQRQIMLFMPLIFVFFIIRFPAGLLVYWITTNLWTVAQQYTVRRYIGPTVAATPGDADSGSGGSGGGGGPKSSGGGSGSGGGIGGRLRDRLAAAQSEAESSRRERGSSATNGGGGGSRAPAKTGAQSGESKSTATRSGARKSTASKSGSSGGRSGGGSGSGNGSTPPPRSPRKKKKRSGRRR